MRGNRLEGRVSNRRRGSIPACAGEPHPNACSMLYAAVYPRVCGGTEEAYEMVARLEGLSPRVRGNPDLGREPLPPPRSIPACAGEPATTWVCRMSIAVYPRVCGGTRLMV